MVRIVLLITACVVFNSPLRADDTTAIEHFEKKIRPLLLTHCMDCHGAPGKKIKGGLNLASKKGLWEGGESGPVVVAKDPAKSVLIQAVKYTDDIKMPPKGKLKAEDIAALETWVKAGAVWPEASETPTATTKAAVTFTPEQKAFWSFQPIQDPAVPASKLTNPIDAFIRMKLAEKQLDPAAKADKRTLIRRATFDLIGLPPTVAEIDAFLKDDSPNAFATVVERLLASPHYGERWGRHWLDLARYADTNGLDENTGFMNAWRYRDYVIQAFNNNLPYDQFIIEQLAGDLLPPSSIEQVNHHRLTATGFLVLGPKLLAEPDKEKMVMDIVDEQIDVTGKVFLGLTIGCARCHDHKFDPLPTRDYYGWAGIFKSTKTMQTLSTVAKANERPLNGAKDQALMKAHADKVVATEKKRSDIRAKVNPLSTIGGTAGAQANIITVNEAVGLLKRNPPPIPVALAVQDEAKVSPVKIHIRGNHRTLGEQAPRIMPRIIAGENQNEITGPTSGRLELAKWIASPNNPLTARVMVNRIWLHHFGQGLVRSPDNFGKLGEKPSHPELLDWLATRFVQDGWNIKALHKRIVLSETYQQEGVPNANALTADPDNRLLSYFPRNRLEAESIRDAMLSISGELDPKMGGSLFTGGNFEYAREHTYEFNRRSVYLPVIRSNVFDFFQAFDFAEPNWPSGQRAQTVVPAQALFLMNNSFVLARAKAWANVLLKAGSDDNARVQRAYLQAFGREPTTQETQRALDFIANYAKVTDKPRAWAAWCQVLFSSSEFLSVD